MSRALASRTFDCQHGVSLTDSLQIHTIELPKYNYDSGAISTAAPLTQWAFFLDRAARLEAAELKRLLPALEYAKATQVMETIARTPQERQLYESRRKAELDYNSGLHEAHERGLEEGERLGLEKGERLGLEEGKRLEIIDQIRFLQDLLQEPQSTDSDLAAVDLAALRRLREELKDRLRR